MHMLLELCRFINISPRGGFDGAGCSRVLPFLPSAEEVVAGGARATYSTVSFFEIVGLLLEITDLDTTALRLGLDSALERAIGTSIAVSGAFRITNHIGLQGQFPSPSSSCEHFIQAVREHKLQMTPIGLAVFIIRVAGIIKFVPRVAPYGEDHRWLQEWTWAQARDREDRLTTAVWILKLGIPLREAWSRRPRSQAYACARLFYLVSASH